MKMLESNYADDNQWDGWRASAIHGGVINGGNAMPA